MSNMRFRCGSKKYNLTAAEFCQQFTLVINQGEDVDNQVCIQRLKDDEDFALDADEKKSILDTLGIVVIVPKKKKGVGSENSVRIGGNVTGSNINTGSGNQISNKLPSGLTLTTVVSGNGIYVGPPEGVPKK